MPMEISRLRRWIVVSAVLLAVFVAAVYLYARHRVQNALKDVPGRIGVEVQQSANGFSVSRSEQGRTLFKIQANKAVQFREGGRVELHDVTITLYGRDSTRFDQIYGADFIYDPRSGDVSSKGEVEIDLEANPQGLTKPDQAPPKELKNPLHLRTSALAFNQKTGNAFTNEKVEFSLPQARGSSQGASYVAETAVLTLQSAVQIDYGGPDPVHLTAAHGIITKQPRNVLLEAPTLLGSAWKSQAQKATLFLNPDNSIDRMVASGQVMLTATGKRESQATGDDLTVVLKEDHKSLHTAVLAGNVKVKVDGAEPVDASASRVVMNFVGRNRLNTVHSEGNVRLAQHQKPTNGPAQDLEIAASAIDFASGENERLKQAETEGPGTITIRRLQPAGQQTIMTADRVTAKFDDLGQLATIHGAPHAKLVSQVPGEKDRVSSSDSVDALFKPGNRIESLLQQGSFEYADGERRAWSGAANYLPAEEILTLTQSPRVASGGMMTTAKIMRLNRGSGEATAEGDVKTTYSDLKATAEGALLASGSPVHVTARSMTANRSPTVATYVGNARLWQDANVVEAPTIQFDRDRRFVVAQGSDKQPVSTVLVEIDKSGKAMPVAITAKELTYTDSERHAHFEGNVISRGANVTISAASMDVFLQLQAAGQVRPVGMPAGKIDHIIAQGSVLVSQPDRRATGEKLLYTSKDDKFVMTGGPPSIFDAEHGKITGVSLTFFRGDGRVVVEGNEALPTVTQTRVAR